MPKKSTKSEWLIGGGEMGELIRSKDWAATPLGPRHSWPPVLRTSINTILSSAFPMVVLWGRDLLLIYNDAYRVIAAGKHPAALGQSTRECWPEVWHINKPIFEGVLRRGEVTYLENQLFPVTRHGYLEESYFTLSYSPIWAEDGTVGGAFVTLLETSSAVLSDRRMRTLRDLASQTSDVSDVDSACQAAVRVLQDNLADVPFGLLYLMKADGTELRLAGSFGVEEGSPAAIVRTASSGEQRQHWPVSATLSRGVVEVHDLQERFGLLSGGWAGPARSALAFALRPISELPDLGIVVLGVSSARALDQEYRAFFQLTANQIASAVGQAHTRMEERLRARAELVASEAKYRQIVETTHEGIWITDPDSVTHYVNPQMAAMLGYELEELHGRDISKFLSPQDLPAFEEEERQLNQAGAGRRQAEYRLIRKDGSLLSAEVNRSGLLDDQGRLTGILHTFADITERKRAEDALRDAEARLRLAAETTDFGAFDFYPPSGELIWSAQAKRHFGLPPDAQVDYQVFLRGLHPKDRTRVNQLVTETMRPGSSGEYVTEYRTIGLEDGKERWIEARGRVFFDQEGKPVRFIGATVDITRRKRAEEELRELNRSLEQRVAERTAEAERRAEELRALAVELARTEEREQRRLADWLHDELQQVLVAAKMQIQLTHSAVKEPALRELLEKACHLVDESIGQSRSLTADLTPPILYHSGLVSGLEQLAHWFAEKHHLRVTVEPRADLQPENQEAAVVLFNAARELLFNVVKHAGVNEARVILSETDGRVQLSVEDQGAGFDAARLAEGTRAGFGLLNMRERLHFIGGELEVQSAPGRGTRITLLAPSGPGWIPSRKSTG